MKSNAMLAIDLGASNGRVVWGSWKENGLQMRVIHRFVNSPIQEEGLLCWNIPQLFAEVIFGIQRCVDENLPIDSLGLCSWGNTVGILNDQGKLLRMPIFYRETATNEALPIVYQKISRREMFRQTLFIPMTIQPAIVLNYLYNKQPEQMKKAHKVLMISDLFNYFLCGIAASERTMAATSQMLDMRTGQWNESYMRSLSIQPQLFPKLINNATVLAPLKDQVVCQLGMKNAPVVIAVSGHDTAAAAGCVPMDNKEESLYVSCGTWSCMGCGVTQANESEDLIEFGVTNDVGLFGQHHLRFNHTGLWILQECRRQWITEGIDMDFAQIEIAATQSESFMAYIDTEDESFFRRDCMPQKVQDYCRRTKQRVPLSAGEIARVILESLAFRYRYSADVLELLSRQKFSCIWLLGGGAKNKLLCQFTANALNKKVLAGPEEASVIGNFMQQGLAMKTWDNDAQARDRIGKTENAITYLPSEVLRWEKEYRKALKHSGWKQIELVGE